MATETGTITVGGVVHGALVTAAEYDTFLGLTAPNATQVQASIYDATAFITTELGRIFVTEDNAYSILESFTGKGKLNYYPKQGPVVTVGVIQFYNGIEWETIDSTIYEAETDGNKIFFRTRQTFHRGINNWRINYTFGYPSIPDDIKRACMMLVRYYVGQAEHDGNLQSQSDGEQTLTYFGKQLDIPPLINEIISKYKRFNTAG